MEPPENKPGGCNQTHDGLFEFLLEHIPDRIYFKNAASRFIAVSRAKAERHGISDPSRMIGKIDLDFFAFEHAMEALEDERRILRTGEAIVGKIEKETLPNGRTEWALTTKMPLRDPGGAIIGTCGISKDITALKEMEEALAQSNTELGRALAELQQTHEAVKAAQAQLLEAEKAQTAARLAAGVAHEVRNPLNILGAGLEFLSSDPAVSGDPTVGAILGDMRDAIRRADAVICALMDTSNDTLLDRQQCDLNALIDAAVIARQRNIAARAVSVIKDLAQLPDMTLEVKKIASALDAILLNAVEAMSDRGGELILRTGLRELTAADIKRDPGARSGQRLRVGGKVVAIEIEDNGHGIAPACLLNIFDPFFTTKETGSGAGLGLTVCRKIIEMHGGIISVSNRSTGGVGVRILLPTGTLLPGGD